MYRCIRVAQFGPSSVLQLASADASHMMKPGPGQVLIQALAAGVNPVDTYIRSGQYSALPQLPYTPGSDCAGRVLAVGEGVSRLSPGDRVYTVATSSGAYSQLVLASQAATFRLPDCVANWPEAASLAVPAFTALRALHSRGQARPGETVLVHGASGSVGLACCQAASAAGLRVFATAGSPAGRQLALQNGASRAFDHSAPGYVEGIAEAARDSGGVHLVVEMLASANLAVDCQLAAPGGRVLVVGSRGSLDFNPRLTMAKEVSIGGVFLRRATDSELAGYAQQVESLLLAGSLRPVVDRRFPLAEAAAAHDYVIDKAASCGKVVLDIDEWSSA